MTEVVPRALDGQRLDRVVALVAGCSRAEAAGLVDAGAVRVGGRPVTSRSHRVAEGDALEVDLPDRPAEPELAPDPGVPVPVVHEDEHLLVVDKPDGVVVHPSGGHARGTLVHGLLAHAVAGGDDPQRPGIVHRLDKDTSGLLVVARTDEAHRRLQRLLRRRAITRKYLALVRGRPKSRRGRIEAPIGRDRRDPTRISLDTATPRDAVTEFDLVELFDAHALLRVRLETGRTHQIRVHLAAIDLPVSGDPVYGVAGDLGLERQFLHAARLAFRHPVTGEEIDCESPLPDDLGAALARARK
jgi:23S rRNA pseudouridine1911/1915/1917 synthase